MKSIYSVLLLLISLNLSGQATCNKDNLKKEIFNIIHKQDNLTTESIYLIETVTFNYKASAPKIKEQSVKQIRFSYIKKGAILRFYALAEKNALYQMDLIRADDKKVLKSMKNDGSENRTLIYDYVIDKDHEFIVNFTCLDNSHNCMILVSTVVDKVSIR